MFSGHPSPVFIFVFELALLSRRTGHYRTSATPESGTATRITTMCTLKKQCYACKGGCVEQVVVHCPSYLAGYDCGQSDVTRAGQAGGMLLQEILHMSPCPKHGIDNPHDQCKVTYEFPMCQISINTECLLGNLASLSALGLGSRSGIRAESTSNGHGRGKWNRPWLCSDNHDHTDMG